MKKGICLLAVVTVLMVMGFAVRNVGAYGSYGSNVNAFCSSDPYTGDCLLCHTASSKSDPTDAKDAYLAGDLCYFCVNDAKCTTTCTDSDGDGYSVNGGSCGQVDCDDSNSSVNPGAVENCTNGVDDDCDGFADGFDADCGACLPTMQHERGKKCSDGIDNDCDGLTDSQDPDCSGKGMTKEICDDGIDNNGNGKVDCADKKDCGKDPVCR
jgi:hypothetical protein